MTIVISHIVRLVIDLVLLYIMLDLEIYELTLTVKILVTGRIIIGHVGRIFQYIIGSLDDMEGCAAGAIANIVKTILESVILLSLHDDISTRVAAIVIICIFARNIFEAVSLCEEFSD